MQITKKKMTNNPKSLYIHIPFCEQLCDYCDFPKLQYFRIYAEKYIDNLIDEIKSFKITQKLETIYIGGGTPTSLEDDLFEKLLKFLHIYVNDDIEYTIEANPESLSENKIKMMKMYGVNRVSIGVESTDNKILKVINRKHTFEDVVFANKKLKEAGFANISFDLILGLPNVSLKMLEKDIINILDLNPTHISCYSLTVHPNTVFGINKVNEPNEDFSREAYDLIHNLLKEAGYRHYEVSNWCKDNKRSKHNLTYWKNNTYYGAGVGAAGYLSNYRYKNTRNIIEYNDNKVRVHEKEYLNTKDIRDYQIILNLRTDEGIDLDEFKNRFNIDLLSEYNDIVSSLIDENLLIFDREKNALIPTYEGFMVLDTIILKFI